MPGSPPFCPPGSPQDHRRKLGSAEPRSGVGTNDSIHTLCTVCFDVPCACNLRNETVEPAELFNSAMRNPQPSDHYAGHSCNPSPVPLSFDHTWQQTIFSQRTGAQTLCVGCWEPGCSGACRVPDWTAVAQKSTNRASMLCLHCMDTNCECERSISLCIECCDLPCSCNS
eukprot:SAG31_NODE_4055_length_3633_cov_1.566497_3_plen_170_part_00